MEKQDRLQGNITDQYEPGIRHKKNASWCNQSGKKFGDFLKI
jgi:hypothetical protein